MSECPVGVTEGESIGERTKGVVYDHVVASSYDDQDDHQYGFWDRTGLLILILHKEEQSAETELLNVHPNKHVLECLWEEQASSVSRRRLPVPVEEEILAKSKYNIGTTHVEKGGFSIIIDQ